MTNHKLREKINSLNLNINQDKKIIEKNQPQLGIDIITAITTDYSDGEEKVKESLILAFDSKKHPVMLVDSRNVDSINDKSKGEILTFVPAGDYIIQLKKDEHEKNIGHLLSVGKIEGQKILIIYLLQGNAMRRGNIIDGGLNPN